MKILKIIYEEQEIPIFGNSWIYDDWDIVRDKFVYRESYFMGKDKLIHQESKVCIDKSKCIVITEENKLQYPEYLV